VKALAVEFPTAALCKELNVSRSGYYEWLSRGLSAREEANRKLLVDITEAFEDSRKTYGSPRVTQALRRANHRCSRNRVARLMRRAGLRGLQRPGFQPRTTESNHDLAVAPNRLKKAEQPSEPNRVWVADITYIATLQGWLYLAAVMDLYSRKIVGWTTADHLKSSLPKEALSRALAQRCPGQGLVHHSDRGIQYASSDYKGLLQCQGILPSMSAQGNCYDNATMESFFSTLKTELLHRRSWQSHQEVRLAIFDYIETFYNRKRLHSSLNYQSPAEFEKRALCKN
jgi:transposase InsO family protein